MKVDVHSATWQAVRSKIHDSIEAARKRLEMSLPVNETDIERGKIIALREVIAMGDPPKTFEFNENPTD